MSKRIWIVIGLGLIVLLVAGLVIFLIVVLPNERESIQYQPTPIAMQRFGEGAEAKYIVDGEPYRVVICENETTPWMDAGWRTGYIGQRVHDVYNDQTMKRMDTLFSMGDDIESSGYYVSSTGHVIYPEEIELPDLLEIEPSRIILGQFGLDPRCSEVYYQLTDDEALEDIMAMLKGGFVPSYTYTQRDIKRLQLLEDERVFVFIEADQVPGCVYRVALDYATIDWDLLNESVNESMPIQYNKVFIALQIMKHGERVW